MTTRRDFLKAAAAGIVFCGCGMVHGAHAQAPRQKLPVTVGGKRIKTIDVHSHCHFREAGAVLGDEGARMQLPPVNNAESAFIEIEKRLAAMDEQAIDMEVLSINPFWYGRDRDLAAKIVKIQNEKLAELCAAKPDRFAAFASLTLQGSDVRTGTGTLTSFGGVRTLTSGRSASISGKLAASNFNVADSPAINDDLVVSAASIVAWGQRDVCACNGARGQPSGIEVRRPSGTSSGGGARGYSLQPRARGWDRGMTGAKIEG